MATEIERKFLVKGDSYKELAVKKTLYKQGYLTKEVDCTVRVRIAGDKAYLTIKGRSKNISRSEFEYAIPLNDANEMLESLCKGGIIEKYRYIVPCNQDSLFWEVDEFLGNNQGLVIAEIELESEDQAFNRPVWLDKEVSGNAHYYNLYLANHPYSNW